MKVEVLFSPNEVGTEYEFRGKTAVVVDVLRASSSIITAIHHGARQIIPAATVQDAMRLAKDLFRDNSILCGERGGKLIDGFDIDNSPANYRAEVVKGQSLFYTSTNGAGAILKAKYAKEVFIGGFINISAVAERVNGAEEVVILCAGESGRFSMEDALCAGMIVSLAAEKHSDAELTDGAVAAKLLYERCQNGMMAAVRSTMHAVDLEREGFQADVNFCATADVYADVPFFDGNIIRAEKSKA